MTLLFPDYIMDRRRHVYQSTYYRDILETEFYFNEAFGVVPLISCSFVHSGKSFILKASSEHLFHNYERVTKDTLMNVYNNGHVLYTIRRFPRESGSFYELLVGKGFIYDVANDKIVVCVMIKDKTDIDTCITLVDKQFLTGDYYKKLQSALLGTVITDSNSKILICNDLREYVLPTISIPNISSISARKAYVSNLVDNALSSLV